MPRLYESNQTKLMNKFILALQCLSSLANECVKIESTVLKSGPVKKASTLDFTKDVNGYQFFNYMRCIITHSKLEQINAKVIFTSLHQHFHDNIVRGQDGTHLDISDIGSDLVQEMHKKTELLNNLNSLNILRDVVLDVNELPAELELINETLAEFVKGVRAVTVCLWSLKVLFESNKIKDFSMNIV